jgi:hypothetical protein
MSSTGARNQATVRSYDVLDRMLEVDSPNGLGQNVVRGVLTGTWTAASSVAYMADELGRGSMLRI